MKSNQPLVVNLINEKIDIPNLSEKEEAVLYDKIYEAVEEAAIAAIMRI